MDIHIKCANEVQAIAIANFLEEADNLLLIEDCVAVLANLSKSEVNYENKDLILINIE